MIVVVSVRDESGATVASEEIELGELAVIMVKTRDGQPIIDGYQPLEVDEHPDTLRQIGGRIVDFAK